MKLEQEIFEHVLTLTSPEAKEAYLASACGTDDALRKKIDELLAAFQDAADLQFLNSSAKARPDLLREVPGSLIGRYKLLQQIGEGGCGVVYLAEQTETVRRRVALKVIKLGMDTKLVVARFEAERQALALMDHPNIAKVLDGGATESGRPYFVMELVRGIRITDYCAQKKLPTAERIDLFIKVCHAIQHAHQKGIIHRDIKPSNILVTLHDGVPVPKVIDFGIAKATTDQRLTDHTLFTALDQFIGTPAYMSPEQAEMSGLDIDTRSDIYSLGVLLYELLTGKTPFDSKELLSSGVAEMRRTILEKEPMLPSTRLRESQPPTPESPRSSRRSALSTDLDWIVMKALEKDRTRRYETANGLAADLQRHLSNEPVVARPPSTAYRFQKAFRRNKLAFGAAAIIAAVLLVGFAFSSWQMVVAQNARQGEAEQRALAEAARKVAVAEAEKASASEKKSRRLLYTTDMYLAQQSLKLNNVGKARRLLERSRPQSGEEDLRGWEWRYLWQLTRNGAFMTLTNRPTAGSSVSFSPDGSRLAVGWNGGRVEVWDVPGRRLLQVLTGVDYRHRHGHVAFSPVRNLLAATSEPGVVALYDLDSGNATNIWRAPDLNWDLRDISFSPDGSTLAIYAGSVESLGDAAWTVNVASAEVSAPFAAPWSNSSLHGAAVISPDNQRLYVTRNDSKKYRYTIQCLDLRTRQEIWQTHPERDLGATTLALSPDGQRLASGSGFEDPTIRIWDTATGRSVTRLEGHAGWVCQLTFSQDGMRLISAASDQTIRYWDTTSWSEIKPLRGHSDEVYAVAISQTAQLAASAGKDGNLMLWKEDGKAASNGNLPLPENLRAGEVAFLDRANALLMRNGKPLERIDLNSPVPTVVLTDLGSPTNFLGFFGRDSLCHWNGRNAVTVHQWNGADFTRLGDIATHSALRPLEFAYHPARQSFAWNTGASSNATHVASLSPTGLHAELTSDIPWMANLRFNDDGKFLSATATRDHSLRVWNLETAKIVVALDQHVRAVAFANDGRTLVAAIEKGNDHEIGFFDLAQATQPPRRISGKSFCGALAVSPDGRLVASASAAGEVRLFNATTGVLLESVHAHLNGAHSVAFSDDGKRLLSTSTGLEAVKIWDVIAWQELLTLRGVGSGLEASAWSADGNVILAGAPWQLWRAPSWEEIAAAETARGP